MQLMGMSFFLSNWSENYWNAATVDSMICCDLDKGSVL
ncbi:hypothetical protein C8E03_11234 [Lachnotalea glycerini]|uniref:Uncharacterized protein n=1 Tax=Lachnotalea glycerini TaxID=1763509 RepID=A0A318EN42_9FIRM|nr:hypothetical protein C8E03_11234 [Lachnotalea glycerini]